MLRRLYRCCLWQCNRPYVAATGKPASAAAPTLHAPPALRSHRFSLTQRPALHSPPPDRPTAPARTSAPPPPLPVDVHATILSLCGPKDAARAAQSCRAWRTAFSLPGAWATLDLTAAGPFGRGAATAERAAAALQAFLAFVLADGGQRLGCLRTLAVEHSGGTAAQLRDERAAETGALLHPCLLPWETAEAIVAAASSSLRSVALHGPPPTVHGGPAAGTACHLRTGAFRFLLSLRVFCQLSAPGLAELTAGCAYRTQPEWRWTPGRRRATRRSSRRCRLCGSSPSTSTFQVRSLSFWRLCSLECCREVAALPEHIGLACLA